MKLGFWGIIKVLFFLWFRVVLLKPFFLTIFSLVFIPRCMKFKPFWRKLISSVSHGLSLGW